MRGEKWTSCTVIIIIQIYSVHTFSLVALALSSFKLVFSASTFGVSDMCADKPHTKKEREGKGGRERRGTHPESFITPLYHLSIALQLLTGKST